MHSNVHFIAQLALRQSALREGRRLHVALIAWAAMAALLLICTGFGPPILSDGSYPPLRLAPEQIDALIESRTVPTVTAASALVIDLQSGKTLYEKNPNEARPPASTAKLMTALVVVDQVDLDEMAVVTAHAAETEGSRMGLTAGERLTVGELLHGLLIPSGNDAAVALAEHAAGAEEDFVAMMNGRARDMGLASTHFVNVHGLDAEGQTTSAADLAIIARAALQNEHILAIVAQATANVAGHALQNTNELLGTYEGADGVKTGTTDEAGECLVATVTRDGRKTLLVELGSRERYVDARKLFDYVANAYSYYQVALPDNALAWAVGSDGQAYRLQSATSSAIFVPAWQRSLIAPVLSLAPGAVMTGTEPVGELRWTLGAEQMAAVPLTVVQGP